MVRYIPIQSRWSEELDCNPAPIYEKDNSSIKTGLLNSAGIPLYRVRDRHPLGFIVKKVE